MFALNIPAKQGNKHLRVAYIHYSDRAVFVTGRGWFKLYRCTPGLSAGPR